MKDRTTGGSILINYRYFVLQLCPLGICAVVGSDPKGETRVLSFICLDVRMRVIFLLSEYPVNNWDRPLTGRLHPNVPHC